MISTGALKELVTDTDHHYRSVEKDTMAKVLLHSTALDFPGADKWDKMAYHAFLESARRCRFGAHTLTSDPDTADLIIFSEAGLGSGIFAELVRRHPYTRKYREKCFMWDCGDYALPFLPGIYATLGRKQYSTARTRSGHYIRLDENPYIEFIPLKENPEYLATFIGSMRTHPVRAKLATLPRDYFLIEDTSSLGSRFAFMGGQEEDRHKFWSNYADGMAAGAFSLCPRGLGRSSVRLFESMRMGRCPVVISDEWVPPSRVNWKLSSLTVPEKDAGRLTELLEAKLPEAAEMGIRARKEWETYYAQDVFFHWVVEDCLEMLQARRIPEGLVGRLAWLHLLEGGYRYWRIFLSSKRQLYLRHGRVLI